MRQAIALTLITGTFLPFLLWGASAILENRDRSIRNEEKEKSARALLQEVRSDVKLILQRIPNHK